MSAIEKELEMFKEYDVRGKCPQVVNEEKFCRLGKALEKFSKEMVICHDFRRSGTSLTEALAAGFSGEVLFLGAAPTPAVAFLGEKLGCSVTASHNPAGYNGAKFSREKRCFWREELLELEKEFEKAKKPGKGKRPLEKDEALIEKYSLFLPPIERGLFDLCGGAACALKEIFPEKIFGEPDPDYERHSAEPKDETLEELKKRTKGKRVAGFAFDGDADRLVVVDKGKTIAGDVLAAFAAVKLFPKKSRVALTIDCSNEVFRFLRDEGMTVDVAGVGDVNLVKTALEKGAVFAAEKSGHYSFFKHMAYSDGIYAAAVLSQFKAGEFAEFASRFKSVVLKQELFFPVDFGRLEDEVRGERGLESIATIDGIKADFPDYSLLIRASKTEPKIRVNAEAGTRENAEKGLARAVELAGKSRKKA